MSRCVKGGAPSLHAARCRDHRRVPVPDRPSRRRNVRGRQRDPQRGQPRKDPRRDGVLGERRTRTPRRGAPASQRAPAGSSAGPLRRHVERQLLRTREPAWGHAAGADEGERVRVQRQHRLRSGREHRVGNARPLDAEGDGGGVDGLVGAPREHPRCALQRHGDRRMHPPAGVARAWAAGGCVHAGLRCDRGGEGQPPPRTTSAGKREARPSI